MKKYLGIVIAAFSLAIAGCSKTETQEAQATDSCQLQIDSLKAEIEALKKTTGRHHSSISHSLTSKITIDTSILQKTPHQIHEEQDEADEADHQQPKDSIITKITVNKKGEPIVHKVDTVIMPPPHKSFFEKVKALFSK